MTEQNERLDDVIAEFEDAIRQSYQALMHLKLLKEHGVEYIDENMEPVVPDNVLMFPANRSRH